MPLQRGEGVLDALEQGVLATLGRSAPRAAGRAPGCPLCGPARPAPRPAAARRGRRRERGGRPRPPRARAPSPPLSQGWSASSLAPIGPPIASTASNSRQSGRGSFSSSSTATGSTPRSRITSEKTPGGSQEMCWRMRSRTTPTAAPCSGWTCPPGSSSSPGSPDSHSAFTSSTLPVFASISTMTIRVKPRGWVALPIGSDRETNQKGFRLRPCRSSRIWVDPGLKSICRSAIAIACSLVTRICDCWQLSGDDGRQHDQSDQDEDTTPGRANPPAASLHPRARVRPGRSVWGIRHRADITAAGTDLAFAHASDGRTGFDPDAGSEHDDQRRSPRRGCRSPASRTRTP